MGLAPKSPVEVTTATPNDALDRLFGFGDSDGRFFVPFAHSKRFALMAPDAGRSIVQSTIKKWRDGTITGTDPRDYLDIRSSPDQTHLVSLKPRYPAGLGYGKHGFALRDGARLSVPAVAFGLWYDRQTELPEASDWATFFSERLASELHLDSNELRLVFSVEEPRWPVVLQSEPVSNDDLQALVHASIARDVPRNEPTFQTVDAYRDEVRALLGADARVPLSGAHALLQRVLDAGAKSVLLYGPPRTGETRAVLDLLAGTDGVRIQLHDGWGYDELIVGLRPGPDGTWANVPGPLLCAIRDAAAYVVIEEINRTDFAQSIGEVFSLLEDAYRGPTHTITLRDGSTLHIPEDMLIVCTMNTLDRSTENVDDALLGRMAAVEFLPSQTALREMLDERHVADVEPWLSLFDAIQSYHPMGHGYFASVQHDTIALDYYQSRLRPVLQKHLAGYRQDDLTAIDAKATQLFGP